MENFNESSQETRDHELNDLAVLAPDGSVIIGRERITVRRFRFLEGLRLETECRALIEDLAAVLDPRAAVEATDYGKVMDVLARHEGQTLRLLEVSTGKPAEWIVALDDEDGYALLMAFWGVNHPFFVRRLMVTLMAKKMTESPSAPAESYLS